MKVQDLILPGSRKTIVLPGRGALPIREVAEHHEGRPILLLHGWGATADLNFATVYRPLAHQWHLIAPDLRGHGSGIVSRDQFSLEVCADDAAALVRSLGTGPAVCVGYSMGGPVALLMARRHPDVVAGVVLCATAPRFVTNTWERLLLMRFSSLAFTVRHAQDNVLPLRYVAPRILRVLEATGSLARFDATPWLSQLSVPASVVMTMADHLVSPEDQKLLLDIPDTAVFEIDAGHEACVTHSGRFVRAVEEGVQSVENRVDGSPRRRRSRRSAAKAPAATSGTAVPASPKVSAGRAAERGRGDRPDAAEGGAARVAATGDRKDPVSLPLSAIQSA